MPTWKDIAYKYVVKHDHTAEAAGHLVAGNTVVIPDPDGDLIPFFVRKDSLSAGAKGKIKLVECDHLYYELADGPIRSYNLTNAIPATAIAVALEGTRWSLGNIAPNLAALVKDFRAIHVNPLEFLRLIEKEFEARLKFRAEVEGAGITAYKVDLLEIEQVFSGKRFEFGRDLQDITIAVDCSDIKTALFGYSLSEEIDPATGEPLPMTFRDVEWRRAEGNPADKPLGQDWVGDEEARELYGICDPATGQMLHRFGKYESQAETPEGLLQATWLIGTRYHFRPRVTVEGNVADLEQAKIIDIKTGELVQLEHEKVRLGQITYVVARDKGLLAAVDVRVTRIERYLKEPWRTRIVFGDPIPLDSDYIAEIKRMAAWRDKRRRMLDRGRGGQTVTVASEDDSLAPYYAKYIVPSGSTSAEDKINEAINALPSSGGKVLLQEGTYIIDGDIVYSKDNVSIEGQGIDNTIIFFKASSDPRIYANAKSKVSLKNLTVDGNKANNAGGLLSGVLFDTISGFDINNIAVKNVQTEISGINRGGIALVSCNDGDVKGLALNDNWGDGLYCYDCNNVTIDYIRSNGNQVQGINIDDSVDMHIGSNICIDNGIYGIRLNNVTDSNIVGNTCNNANSPGGAGLILIGNSHRNTVTGNAANKNHSGQGIIIAGNENTVTGNACCDNTSYGIWVVGNKNTVQANKCSGNSYGIVVDAGATANHVTNNDLLDNVSGALVDSGTSTDPTAGNRRQ